MFGFWRYLSSSAHEKTLWVPYLHRAFPAGTQRGDLDARIGRIHALRNRVAHHEPLVAQDVRACTSDFAYVARLIAPSLGAYMMRTTRVDELLNAQP